MYFVLSSDDIVSIYRYTLHGKKGRAFGQSRTVDNNVFLIPRRMLTVKNADLGTEGKKCTSCYTHVTHAN